MSERKTYTQLEIIADAIQSIDRMKIPVSMIAELGIELSRIKGNLEALKGAMEEKELERQGFKKLDLDALQAAPQAQEGENDEGTLGGDGSDGLSGGDGSEHPEGE